MKNPSIRYINDFNELNSFIINTVSPTILALAAPDTFGQFWLERMKRTMVNSSYTDLIFNITLTQESNELAILTKEGGGPIIFFIKDRQIVEKSMGRVSEHDFMNHLNSIYPISQAA